MNPDVIKALIEALAASDLAELEYSRDGESLRLVKRGAGTPAATRSAAAQAPARTEAPLMDRPATDTIVAPLYGIVHLQQTPGAPPLVAPGQSVVAGQVLCVIEAMKVFNQIRAERDCVIASVLVRSGQEVEAGEKLFGLG